MRDFTKGPILRHLLGTAGFLGFGLVVQTLNLLVDIYFVGQLGGTVQAGVTASGSALFVVMAVNQLVLVGTLSLVSRAIGRKDKAEAQLIFEQALGIALFVGLATLLLGYSVGGWVATSLSADDATAAAARAYLFFYLPALALMYPIAAIDSTLRGAGIIGLPIIIQSASVILNIVLSPMLILGWGIGVPLGAAGAGLATSIATFASILVLQNVFPRLDIPVHLRIAAPKFAVWRRISSIGLPASGEFLMTFFIVGTIYLTTRQFGAETQAGYGVGSRVMQAVFLPTLAIAFAIVPIAGHNYGAGRFGRVKTTFATAAMISGVFMLGLTLLCQWNADLLVRPFAPDPEVRAVAANYLRMVSWTFLGIGLVYCCSATFQALGNTLPPLFSGASRLLTFVFPMLMLTNLFDFTLDNIWILINISVAIHVLISLILLQRLFHSQSLAKPSAVT